MNTYLAGFALSLAILASPAIALAQSSSPFPQSQSVRYPSTSNKPTVPPAFVKSLTAAQTQQILSLLQSFRADSTMIARVKAAVSGSGAALAQPAVQNRTVSPSVGQMGGAAGGATYSAGQDCPITTNPTLGSVGNDVRCLQQTLKTAGFLSVDPTGYFGPATQAALIAWQKKKNVPPTGKFDILSRGKWNSTAGEATASSRAPITPTPVAPYYQTPPTPTQIQSPGTLPPTVLTLPLSPAQQDSFNNCLASGGSPDACHASTSSTASSSASTPLATPQIPVFTVFLPPPLPMGGIMDIPRAITWAAPGATSCVASGGWSGSFGATGTQTIPPALSSVATMQEQYAASLSSTTYTITCAFPSGSVMRTATVNNGQVSYTDSTPL